jgi:sterol desaturase/sphingolipid hydroxylase (fatty acid hydroxylase superfamily)
MEKPAINKSDIPLRLFKSNFLEFFTHIHPLVVIVIWVPTAIFLLVLGVLNKPLFVNPLFVPLMAVAGLFLWTFTEYMLHRFVFHFHAKSDRGKRITFLYHGIHHEQPLVKSRLVMPPVVSIPLGLIFYGLFTLLLGFLAGAQYLVYPLFAGFILGYLCYDLTHYGTHHFKIRRGIPLYLKRYHMFHHFKTPEKRFGVSSPFWDIVFRTKPDDDKTPAKK